MRLSQRNIDKYQRRSVHLLIYHNNNSISISKILKELECFSCYHDLISAYNMSFDSMITRSLIDNYFPEERLTDLNYCKYILSLIREIYKSQGIEILNKLFNHPLHYQVIACEYLLMFYFMNVIPKNYKCKYCRDCKYCIKCISCTNCKICINCIECFDSFDLFLCKKMIKSSHCGNCTNCICNHYEQNKLIK